MKSFLKCFAMLYSTMTKRTGPTNPQLKALLDEIQQHYIETKKPFWKRMYKELNRPARQRRNVNISRINRYTKSGDTVVVPGKVLSSGDLNHAVTVAAWQFSGSAEEKIKKAKGDAVSISELMKMKTKKVKIIG
jgi:large subunit ribosomal protein L18e